MRGIGLMDFYDFSVVLCSGKGELRRCGIVNLGFCCEHVFFSAGGPFLFFGGGLLLFCEQLCHSILNFQPG